MRWLALLLLAPAALAAELPIGGYRLSIADDSGALRLIAPDGTDILGSRPWQAVLEDGVVVDPSGVPSWERVGEGYRLGWELPEASVTVLVSPCESGVELRAEVRAGGRAVQSFDLPATLRFDASRVEALIHPSNGNEGVGLRFARGFFEEQPSGRPVAWQRGAADGGSLARLIGGNLVSRPDSDPPVALSVTEEGKRWLGTELSQRLSSASATVNRPMQPGLADVVLVDSPNGAWLAGSRCGGEGLLLRIGGGVFTGDVALAQSALEASVRAWVGASGAAPLVAVLRVPHGPSRGLWCEIETADWAARLSRDLSLKALGAEVREYASSTELLAAMGSERPPACVINPYGEGLPLDVGSTMGDAVAAIGEFVRQGGLWVETGGYSLIYELRPVRNASYFTPYPAAFADFQHLQTTSGSVAVYRVAPRDWGAWEGGTDARKRFVPGALGCGRDTDGAYARRSYLPWIAAGASWTSPVTRLEVGADPVAALRRYGRDNRLTKSLAEKLPAGRYEDFRKALLVRFPGTARELLEGLPQIPPGALVHTAEYLKGGFDKQYPDQLPPREWFGTEAELAEVAHACAEQGHFLMPYTNPTWWCDHPRGPTFEAAGEAPLARKRDGSAYYERYAENDGWTITFWRPEVQAANRQVVRDFTETYPVGLLFQDQCGARGSVLDWNEGSPAPDAYTEGLLSMVQEDARRAPLSTENGWDQLLPYEAQFCGMSWSVVTPTRRSLLGILPYRERLPAGTWQPWPLAQYLGHDSVAMIHHDLGQFVTDDEMLAWTLALGYGLSGLTTAGELADPERHDWLHWLGRVHAAVCGRYTGVALDGFEALASPEDVCESTLFASRYGDLEVLASTAEAPREVPGNAGETLAPFGFRALAPGLSAGGLLIEGAPSWFVAEEEEGALRVSVLAPEDTTVTVPLPPGRWSPPTELGPTGLVDAQVTRGVLTMRTTARPGAERIAPPAGLADTPFPQWPEERRPARVGVLAMEGLSPQWTSTSPEQWLEDLAPLVAPAGLEAVPVRTPADLARLFAEGPPGWFAVVNPYGEAFPCAEGLDAVGTLEAIRGYIRNGGIWWETGGHSFYAGASRNDGGWESTALGPAGLERLGVAITSDAVDAPAVPLEPTGLGLELLSAETRALISATSCSSNRAPARTAAHAWESLASSEDRDTVAGWRCGGWGWLWRIGGFRPPRELSTRIVGDSLAAMAVRAPLPLRPGSARYLWEVRLSR